MDTRTGKIHEMDHGETIEGFAARLGGKPKDFTPVVRQPDLKCLKCNGTGSVKKGLHSKRFKTCECVM